MDFEKKMEQMDALMAAAKTDDERADVLEKIVEALDAELRKNGYSDEDREEKIAEVVANIMNLLGDLEDVENEAEDAASAKRSAGELDT